MNRDKLIERMLRDVSFLLPCGGAFLNFHNEEHLMLMEDVLLDNYNIDRKTVNQIIGELQSQKTPPQTLSSDDISILRQLGLEITNDVEFQKINLEDFNPYNVVFDTGGGQRVFQPKKINYRTIEDSVKKQQKCYITVSKTFNKLRSEDNIRMVQWGKSRGIDHGFYDQILAIFKLYKNNSEKIILSTKTPPGVNYEFSRAEEINKVLKQSAIPFKLFVEKNGVIKNMEVYVKKADKILGVGKADIALKGDSGEVFWISYKHGDFFGNTGEISKYIPFQQYGSLQGLYDKSIKSPSEEMDINSDDVKNEELKKVINHFIDHVIKKANLVQHAMLNVEEVTSTPKEDIYEIHFKNGKTQMIKMGHPLFDIFDDLEIYRKLVKFLDKGVGNLYFYPQGTKEYYFDFLESKILDEKIMKNIAGKSIYGTDFYVGNTKFGRENINILLQTSRTLEVKQHKVDQGTEIEEIDGIVIKTDEKGHVLFNPNLPNEDINKTLKSIEQYTPVLYCRFTRKEVFRWLDEKGRNMILGGRFIILPKGKKATRAEEIK